LKSTDLNYCCDLAIATSEVEDVREVLDYYHQFDDPMEAFKENLQKLHVSPIK
jgi:hypothetical protein